MLRLIHPFLYDDLLARILADASLDRVLLYGGRGLGKTTLLRRLQRRLVPGSSRKEPPPERTPQATWVDRRTPEGAARIVRWCLRPQGTLIVDDFEHVFTPQVDDAILSLPDTSNGSYRVVVASRKPPRVLERDVLQARVTAGGAHTTPWDDSRAIPTFLSMRMNPWQGDWQARLEVAHHAAMQRLRQETRTRVPDAQVETALELLPSKAAVKSWVELVRQVTGGHPGLVDGSYDLFLWLVLEDLATKAELPEDDDLLVAQCKRSRISTKAGLRSFMLEGDADQDEQDRQRGRLLVLLEDYLLERQMADLGRTLDRLRLSDPDAFTALRDLAEEPDETIVEDARHRLLLLDTGVVFKDDDSRRLRLPEGLVSEAIRAMDPATHQGGAAASSMGQGLVPAPAEEKILSITVSEGAAEHTGDVLVETTNGTRVVPLRGRPWQVFEYFWKNKERYVPADELMEPLEIPSIHSTRNAILRLNQALRAEGVEGVLENRKGVGYRVKNALEGSSDAG